MGYSYLRSAYSCLGRVTKYGWNRIFLCWFWVESSNNFMLFVYKLTMSGRNPATFRCGYPNFPWPWLVSHRASVPDQPRLAQHLLPATRPARLDKLPTVLPKINPLFLYQVPSIACTANPQRDCHNQQQTTHLAVIIYQHHPI